MSGSGEKRPGFFGPEADARMEELRKPLNGDEALRLRLQIGLQDAENANLKHENAILRGDPEAQAREVALRDADAYLQYLRETVAEHQLGAAKTNARRSADKQTHERLAKEAIRAVTICKGEDYSFKAARTDAYPVYRELLEQENADRPAKLKPWSESTFMEKGPMSKRLFEKMHTTLMSQGYK